MVLILVVVEDSLWHDPVAANIVAALIVLILVVVEDSLWPGLGISLGSFSNVLILVVVEDSLWRTNTNNTNPNTEKS